jgi:stress response protein YsnF
MARIADTDATHPHDAAAAPPAAHESVADTQGEQRLPLREEHLQARTQPVETGEGRKEVVTEPTSIEVPVTHEEASIERRPGSGQPIQQPIGEGET